MAKRIVNVHELFPREAKVLEESGAIVERMGSIPVGELAAHYAGLHDEYAKLLKLVVKLTSLGDSVTAKMEHMQEDLMVAKNEAENANRAKSIFLASMSHELRTPLNAVIGFSQILANEPDLPQKFRSHVSIMYKSGEHLLHMINDILNLSKIEAGHMHVNSKPVKLVALIQDLIKLFSLKAAEKSLNLSLQADETLPLAIIGDEDKLRQILINLIGNAIKYTPSGAIVVKAAASSDQLHIEITDTGPGIPLQMQESMFQPFVNGGQRGEESTGLGLAITNRLIKLMGGSVRFESEAGKGTGFYVSIPYINCNMAEIHEEESIQIAALLAPPGTKVLIVDDVKDNRDVLRAFFEELNITVIEAQNGIEGLRIAKEKRPGLILMDLIMPEMDGVRALKQLKKDPELAGIPVIAISASSIRAAEEDQIANGFDAFILKPINRSEFIQAVEKTTGWRFIRSSGLDESTFPSRELLQDELNRLDPKRREEVRQSIEMTDLVGATAAVSTLDEKSMLKKLILKARDESNYSMLLELDEVLNQ